MSFRVVRYIIVVYNSRAMNALITVARETTESERERRARRKTYESEARALSPYSHMFFFARVSLALCLFYAVVS